MEVRNCKGCGRLYNYMGGMNLCPACREELEKKFEQVKAYIYDHPNAPMAEVAEKNDVSSKQIKQWVREERLILTEPSVDGVLCEHCGVPIRCGRFCDKCKTQMANTIGSAIDRPKKIEPEKKQQKDGNKMRFLH